MWFNPKFCAHRDADALVSLLEDFQAGRSGNIHGEAVQLLLLTDTVTVIKCHKYATTGIGTKHVNIHYHYHIVFNDL